MWSVQHPPIHRTHALKIQWIVVISSRLWNKLISTCHQAFKILLIFVNVSKRLLRIIFFNRTCRKFLNIMYCLYKWIQSRFLRAYLHIKSQSVTAAGDLQFEFYAERRRQLGHTMMQPSLSTKVWFCCILWVFQI